MDLLPNEVIEKMLMSSSLTLREICRFAQTCIRYNHIVKANQELWKYVFKNTWFDLFKVMMERNMSGESESSIDWEEEVRQRYIYGVNLRSQVKSLSGLHYHEDEMSHQSFASFLDYQVQTNPHSSGQLFQIHELEAILNDNQPGKNLTNKYYSDKVLRYLRHELVKKEWLRILEGNNEEEQDLFHGAILISQWCQTNITIDEAHYRRQVELIANISIDLIKERYPNNSLSKSKDHACLTDDQAIHLRESIWSPEMCNQILYSLNEVLFTQLKFAGNRDHYFEAHNSFIDKVIDDRVGIPITLCILYQAIAAKLGVKTFAVNFPGHFLIKWKQHPDLSCENEQFTYIDVFENGRFMSHNQVEALFPGEDNHDFFASCENIEVFRRMCRNLVEVGRQHEISSHGLLCLRNALELLIILSPRDIESRLLLSRVYIHLNINLEQVNVMLHEISQQSPASTGIVMFLHQSVQSQLSSKNKNINRKKSQVKKRSQHESVSFTIGTLMKHKKYNYDCVISGWDPTCAASRDWIYQMGVHKLSKKETQPFYNVLVEDGSIRYAAQENLEAASEKKQVSHPEVGKYFKEFTGDHYIPNQEKAAEYPEDVIQ